MRRIVRGLPRNRTKIDKRSRKTLGIRGRIDKRDRFERFEPDARGFGVARFGFRDDEGRRNEIEPVRGVAPPLPGDLLIRRDDHIPRRSRCQIAHYRCLNVRCGAHRADLIHSQGLLPFPYSVAGVTSAINIGPMGWPGRGR